MDNPLRDLTDGAQLEIERARLNNYPYLLAENDPLTAPTLVRFVGGPLDGDLRAIQRRDRLPVLLVPLLGVELIGRFARYVLRERVAISHEYHYEGEESV